ncbi:hypothetical protein ACFFQW_46070 [Umezawaea endophytica]|uniref:Uncharacterized protein n=1 Tax=Umezawaea endophytica TaxID=1654476 RepID=A0A9X2VXU2_9PSEU|nr:hypothetical protein [Umezawaea endophytica]MCS7484601.1 hypothetical protein [Umezawaea endophytica]
MRLLVGFRIFAVLATFCGFYLSMAAQLTRDLEGPWYLATTSAVGAVFAGMALVLFGIGALLTVPMEVYVLKRRRRLVFGAHLAMLVLAILYALYTLAVYLILPRAFENTKLAGNDERSAAETAAASIGGVGLLYYLVWFMILVPFLVIARFSPQPTAIAPVHRPNLSASPNPYGYPPNPYGYPPNLYAYQPSPPQNQPNGPSVWEIAAPLSVPATFVGSISMMQSFEGDKFLGQMGLGLLIGTGTIAVVLLYNYARRRRA